MTTYESRVTDLSMTLSTDPSSFSRSLMSLLKDLPTLLSTSISRPLSSKANSRDVAEGFEKMREFYDSTLSSLPLKFIGRDEFPGMIREALGGGGGFDRISADMAERNIMSKLPSLASKSELDNRARALDAGIAALNAKIEAADAGISALRRAQRDEAEAVRNELRKSIAESIEPLAARSVEPKTVQRLQRSVEELKGNFEKIRAEISDKFEARAAQVDEKFSIFSLKVARSLAESPAEPPGLRAEIEGLQWELKELRGKTEPVISRLVEELSEMRLSVSETVEMLASKADSGQVARLEAQQSSLKTALAAINQRKEEQTASNHRRENQIAMNRGNSGSPGSNRGGGATSCSSACLARISKLESRTSRLESTAAMPPLPPPRNDSSELRGELQLLCRLVDQKASVADVNKMAVSLRSALPPPVRQAKFLWKKGGFAGHNRIVWDLESPSGVSDSPVLAQNSYEVLVPLEGLYELSFGVFSGEKPSVRVFLNGEVLIDCEGVSMGGFGRFENSRGCGNVAGLTFLDFVVLPAKAHLWMECMTSGQAEAFLRLVKI